MFFIRDESIIKFGDCRIALRIMWSIVLALLVKGDFISNSTPSSKMSAVLMEEVGRNSTTKPVDASIFATLSSCAHGCVLLGIITFPVFSVFIF